MYRIMKVLNNNGILVLDDQSGQEQILIGNGAGFGHRIGERLAVLPEGKHYELVKQKASALTRVNEIEPVYIEAAGRMIEEAEKTLGTLQHDILIPMADHIAMAVSRIREHLEIPNPFLQDIKVLFEDEYTAAQKGAGILKELTGLDFSEDEIGYITLHLHAGLAKENVAQSLETARLANRCLGLIEEYMNKKLTADSLGYNRLVSHIRYMLARVRKGESANLDLEDYARHSFPREYEAAAKVCQILEQEMKLHFPQEETGFLAIHIRRVMGSVG